MRWLSVCEKDCTDIVRDQTDRHTGSRSVFDPFVLFCRDEKPYHAFVSLSFEDVRLLAV